MIKDIAFRMVDLTLASSYVPALACVGKCLVMCGLVCVFVPLGGTAAVGALLLVDRVLLNTEYILDVNAVVAFAAALATFNVERQEHPVLPHPTVAVVSALWAAFSLTQHCTFTRVPTPWEMCAAAACAALAASSRAPPEAPQWMAGRALAFSLSVVFVRYTREDELPLVLVRMGVFMLGPLVLGVFVFLALVATATLRPAERTERAAVEEEDAEAQLFREALRQKGHLS